MEINGHTIFAGRAHARICHHQSSRIIRHKGFGESEFAFRDAGRCTFDEASCSTRNEAKMLLAQPNINIVAKKKRSSGEADFRIHCCAVVVGAHAYLGFRRGAEGMLE